MRKYIIIGLFLAVNIAFAAYNPPPSTFPKMVQVPEAVANMNVGILGGSVPAAAGGYSCTGALTIAAGEREEFDFGTGDFCTSDMAETDNSAAVNTYDSTSPFCGSQSLSIVIDYDDEGVDDYVYYDHGSNFDEAWFRFVVTLPDVDDTYYIFNVQGGGSTPNTTSNLYVRINNNEEVYIGSGGTYSSYWNWHAAGDTLLIELHFDNTGSANHEMRVYTCSTCDGSDWSLETNSNSETPTVVAAAAAVGRYVMFGNLVGSSSTTAVTSYIDSFQMSLVGWMGALTSCN